MIFKKSASKGASLLEVSIALGVMGIAVVGASQYYSYTNATKRYARIRLVQKSIARNIEYKLKNPSSIYISSLQKDNSDLTSCLFGSLDGCQTGTAQNYSDFKLVYPIKDGAYRPLTPNFFNLSGQICEDPSSEQCIFEAKAYFYPVCPPAAEGQSPQISCRSAKLLRFAYRVKQREGKALMINDKKLNRKFPSIPSKLRFVGVSASQILGPYINSDCLMGSVVEGFTPTGQPKCKCIASYEPLIIAGDAQFDSSGRPICTPIDQENFQCGNGTVFRGLSETGSAICVDFAKSYTCETKNGDSCGPGYWMQSYSKGDCIFKCSVSKNGNRVCKSSDDQKNNSNLGLSCGKEQVRCCKQKS